jgi:hypothetical protein
MNESRKKVLEMLSAGQITTDEAERLIAALENEKEQPPRVKPKYLRVAVTDSEHTKVNVRVPIQLLRSGVKLASLIPAQARERVNCALHPFDLKNLNAENLDEMLDHIDDLTVDIDENNTKVRLTCE